MAAPTGCAQYVQVTGAGANDYNGIYERVTDNQYVKQGDSTKQIYYSEPPPHLPFLPEFWNFSPNPYAGELAYGYQIPDKNNPPCLQSLPGPGDANWSVGSLGSFPSLTVTAYSPGPDCSDPKNRCAFAAGGESGLERFRRLVALGYV